MVVLLTLWVLGYAALIELMGDGLGGWAYVAHTAAVAPFEALGLDGDPLLVVSALGCSAVLFLGLKVIGLLVSLKKR